MTSFALPKITDLTKKELSGKKVLLRVDLNLPKTDGKISDETRLIRVLPTIKYLLENEAIVILLSHFGRPKDGFDASLSLASITDVVAKHLNQKVYFGADVMGVEIEHKINQLKAGEIILLENLRFHKEEEKNDANFCKKLASLGEIYVNDAFSCSHRKHASIYGITNFIKSYAGISFLDEMKFLEILIKNPIMPFAGIVGGAKISTKIEVLYSLLDKVDALFIGGGMANTFLTAKGFDLGKSLIEKDYIPEAKKILKKAQSLGKKIYLPIDAIVAKEFKESPITKIKSVDAIAKDEMMLDLGINTIEAWLKEIPNYKTIFWNGPLGAFEKAPFDNATICLIKKVSWLCTNNKLVCVAGGGDILSAVARSGNQEDFSYISTAGGAFLEFLEGKVLPGVEVLLT